MLPAPIKHRLTAILAADAAGVASLMAVDERATLAALDAARALFTARIEAAHGRIVDMAGDSMLAVFDAATGAVEAGLAIQQALRAAALAVQGAPLRFRIGVHLGDVIERPDGTIHGDGIDIAARLQAIAEPGGIVASDAVRGVVSGRVGARFRDLGRTSLKHIRQPVHAWVIDGAVAEAAPGAPPAAGAALPVAPPAGSSPATPAAGPDARPAALFVGRMPELAELSAALRAVHKGFGRVALLAGSGGIGKTRLAQQIALLAQREGVTVLWGRCLEEAGAPPYWPWRQLIRSHLQFTGPADAAGLLGGGLRDIAGIVPEVAERFDVPAVAAAVEPAPAATPSASQSRFRLFDAVAGFWRRAAGRAPLLLIFEDLHWADATRCGSGAGSAPGCPPRSSCPRPRRAPRTASPSRHPASRPALCAASRSRSRARSRPG